MVFYKTTADTTNNTYTLEKAFHVDKTKLPTGYTTINKLVNNEEVLHTKVKDYFGIKNKDESKDGEIYSDGKNFNIKNPTKDQLASQDQNKEIPEVDVIDTK